MKEALGRFLVYIFAFVCLSAIFDVYEEAPDRTFSARHAFYLGS